MMDDLVARAKARGFERLVLNTLPTMRHASRLYDEFGFEAIEPYVAEPTDGVLFYGRAV